MKRYMMILFFTMLFFPVVLTAQEKKKQWDLQACLDYAFGQNIRIRKSKIAFEESKENHLQAKGQLFPSLSFSSGHNLTNHPLTEEGGDKSNYNGNYGLNSSVTLYNGGKLTNYVKQQNLQAQVQELGISEAGNDITLAITQAYLQILYAYESVKINQNTLDVSLTQLKRSEELLKAGSISRSNYALFEAQYSTDQYQLVLSQTTLDKNKLGLKQLLELGIMDDMDLEIPEFSSENVLQMLPTKQSVYETALQVRPEVRSSEVGIQIAGLEKQRAKAGYIPSLDLSAGIGTGHASGSDYTFSSQLKNGFNENVGLTLKIPIFSNFSNRTAVRKAELQMEDAQLSLLDTQKELLQKVESVYLSAVSSQNQYLAAGQKVKSTELSYELVSGQYDLGMKNTLELLTEKNNYLSAQQELVQAKYMAILNRQLLNFYQGKAVALD